MRSIEEPPNKPLHWTGSSRFSLFQWRYRWPLLPASELRRSANNSIKLSLLILCSSLAVALAQQPEYLGVPPKEHRASPSTLDRQQFLSASNVQRIVVLSSTRWQLSGLGPDYCIQRFKQAFQSCDIQQSFEPPGK